MDSSRTQSNYQIKSIDCPSCDNKQANLISHVLDIPHYHDFMMLNLNCSECGFRSSDYFNFSSKGHTKYEYHVESIEDDTTKIVRAKEGFVNVPELGIKIEPMNEPTTWIRNIEGVLIDMRKKLVIMLYNPESETLHKLVEERLALLDEMLVYKIPFTIIVEDITGNSIILPANEKNMEITYFKDSNNFP